MRESRKMGIDRGLFDQRFRPYWFKYLLQSIYATASVFIALVILRQQNLVVAASLAATSFTLFVMPHRVIASARNVIGGHMAGLLTGSLFSLISVNSTITQDVVYAATVGTAMLLMAVTDTEHTPAAGTALGTVIAGFSVKLVLGVLTGVVLIKLFHAMLKPILRDLTHPLAARAEKDNQSVISSEQSNINQTSR